MDRLLYKELSYKIIGACYDVYNHLGYGHREKYYHRALAEKFSQEGIKYEQEKEASLFYKDRKIGEQRVDFLVDNRIMLEVKVYPYFKLKNIHYKQTLEYLKGLDLKLAIFVYLTSQGVRFKRIIN